MCEVGKDFGPFWVENWLPSLTALIHAIALPGSEERIEWMAARAAAGESIFSSRDVGWGDPDAKRAESTPTSHDDLSQKTKRRKSGNTGVERMKKTGRWRARPYWKGKRHNLGTFDRERDAIRAAELFWREQLGMFFQHRNTSLYWMGKPKKNGKKKHPNFLVRYFKGNVPDISEFVDLPRERVSRKLTDNIPDMFRDFDPEQDNSSYAISNSDSNGGGSNEGRTKSIDTACGFTF